jgi:hypothetical protein
MRQNRQSDGICVLPAASERTSLVSESILLRERRLCQWLAHLFTGTVHESIDGAIGRLQVERIGPNYDKCVAQGLAREN